MTTKLFSEAISEVGDKYYEEAANYHYPRRALRAAETLDGRLSKRLICRFLRSGGCRPLYCVYFLANMQIFLPANSVANTSALWYDKVSKIKI